MHPAADLGLPPAIRAWSISSPLPLKPIPRSYTPLTSFLILVLGLCTSQTAALHARRHLEQSGSPASAIVFSIPLCLV